MIRALRETSPGLTIAVLVASAALAVLFAWLDPHFGEVQVHSWMFTAACGLVALVAWLAWPSFFSLGAGSLPGLFTASVFTMLVLPMPWLVPLLSDWNWWNWIAAVGLAFTFTMLGIVVVPLAMRGDSFADKRVHRAVEGEMAAALMLFAVCIVCAAYYVFTVRDFALFAALRGNANATELVMLRENALKLLEGPIVKVVSYLRALLFPFATTMLFVIAWTRRAPAIWALFGAAFALNMLMAVISLEKLYAVMLLIQMFLAWTFVTTRKVSHGVLLMSGMAVAAIYLIINLAFFDLDSISLWFDIYTQFIWRIVAVPAALVGAYIDYFSHNDLLMGRTLPIISKFISEPVWIENIICKEYFIGDDTCHANAGYIAYLWADFGWFGVTGGAFLAGLLISGFQAHFFKAPPTAARAALRATLGVHILTVSLSTFTGFAVWAVTALLLNWLIDAVARVSSKGLGSYVLPVAPRIGRHA